MFMHKGRRRSLGIIIGTVLAVLIVFFVSGTITAPELEFTTYKSGDYIAIEGQLTCLNHRNQDGPVTMECAIGFVDLHGNYYALRDKTPGGDEITHLEHGKQMMVSGIFLPESSDRYQQVGVIEVSRFHPGGTYIID